MTQATQLINADAIRKQIKRFFSNDPREIFSELLQNAQRAGAKHFSVTTEVFNEQTTILHVSDDGKGISSFEKLLVIGDSDWSETVAHNQEPIGLGIQALFAHEDVNSVTIRSKGNWLTIDTKRWWADLNYATNWKKRFGADPEEPMSATTISIHCTPKFAVRIKDIFEIRPAEIAENRYWEQEGKGIARGYDGILIVTIDGAPAPLDPYSATGLNHTIIQDSFEGCSLYIGHSTAQTHELMANVVNWYGQIVRFGQTTFPFYLVVREGKPIDLKAPTRQGPITNSKLEALQQHVRQLLWDHFIKPENQQDVLRLKSWLQTLTFQERSQLSFTVAAEWTVPSAGADEEDFDQAKNLQVVTLDDPNILFLDGEIAVQHKGETYAATGGVTTFLPLTGKAFQANPSIHSHLPVKTLWWKPGKNTERLGDSHSSLYQEGGGLLFCQAGEWGFGKETTEDDAEPHVWHAVQSTEEPIFAVLETACWDIDSAFIFVANIKPLAFYQENWPRAAFSPSYDNGDSWDAQSDSFNESVDRNVRDLIGNCVKRNFDMWEIEVFAPKETKVTNIAISEDDKKNHHLVVTFSDGSKKELSTMW